MRWLLKGLCLVLCGVVMSFASNACAVRQVSGDQLEKILADWRTRQQQTRTGRYVITGEIIYPKDRLDKMPGEMRDALGIKTAKEDHVGQVSLELVFDADKHLFKKERTADLPGPDGNYFVRHEVRVFDGTEAKVYRSKNAREIEELVIQRDDEMWTLGGFLDGSDYAVLFAHGILPTSNRHIDGRQLRLPIERSDFVLMGKALFEGNECTIIRTSQSRLKANLLHEFWVDTTRDSSIARWKMFIDSLLAYQLDIKYTHGPSGWLPNEWIADCYYATPQRTNLNYSEKLKATEVTVNSALPESTFRIGLKPHLRVVDSKKMQDLIVDSDGKTLLPFEPASGSRSGAESVSAHWSALLLSLGVILALAAVIWTLLRRRFLAPNSRQ